MNFGRYDDKGKEQDKVVGQDEHDLLPLFVSISMPAAVTVSAFGSTFYAEELIELSQSILDLITLALVILFLAFFLISCFGCLSLGASNRTLE